MKEFLIEQAKKELKDITGYCIEYNEDVSHSAIEGDKWLQYNQSYIWKVATLALIDSNKCDFVNVFISHQRDKNSDPEYIGCLYWRDGENDDIGRCLDRYLKCLRSGHGVFDEE